jgi:hypothetical protein
MFTLGATVNRSLVDGFLTTIHLAQTFSGVLAVFLVTPVYAGNAPDSIVLVEAVQKDESSVSYRMMHLFADGRKQELASLPDLFELVQCRDGMVTYVDGKGNIWSLTTWQGATPNVLARTTFSTQEGMIGKVLLSQEESRFYAVNNSAPGNLKANNRFQVKVFHFDGRESVIASEDGRAYAIHALSPNMLEVVSSKGLFQVDTSSVKTVRIVPFDSGDLPYLALIRDGYSLFSRDGGRLIQVKEGLFGETVFRYKVDSGFGIVLDFDGNKKVALITVVAPDFGGDRLVEFFGSGAEREVYRGSGAIGSACYMRK